MIFCVKYRAAYIKAEVEGNGSNNNDNNNNGNNGGNPFLSFGGKYIKTKRVPAEIKKIKKREGKRKNRGG